MADRMADWESVRLSDIVERRTERNARRNTRVLTISASQGLVDQADHFNRVIASKDLSSYFFLRRGDFAYNKSYSAGFPVGVVRRLDRYDSGVVSPLYICFRPRAEAVHSDFLEQMLRAGRLDGGIAWIAKEGARNHGLLNVRTADFFGLQLDLPPLGEQRRIAEILDTIDETIQATERVIAKVEASLAGTIAAQSVVSQSSETLGQLATKMTNGFVGTATPFYTTAEADGVPYLYGTNIRPNYLDLARLRHIQPAFHASQAKSRLVPGDLLTVQSGHIGTTCVVPDQLGEANCHALIITRVDPNVLRPNFIAEFINSPLGMSQMRRLFVGSTVLHINVKDLRSYHVPIVPIGDQDRFLGQVDLARARIAAERRSLDKMIGLRLGVAADLLSGRVRAVAV